MKPPFPTAKGLPRVLNAGVIAASAALFAPAMFVFPARAQVVGGYGWHIAGSNGNTPPNTTTQAPLQGRQFIQGQSYLPRTGPGFSPQQPGRSTATPVFPGAGQSGTSENLNPRRPIVIPPGNGLRQPDYQSLLVNPLRPTWGSPQQGEAAPNFSRQGYSNQPELPRAGWPVHRSGEGGNSGPILQGSIRVSAPVGRHHAPPSDNGGSYIYAPVVYGGGPALLGGYYYGGYCDASYTGYTYPSVYGGYDGMPQFISNPGVVVVGQPYYPDYATPYLPFDSPASQVTYNQTNYQTNYYVAGEDSAPQIEQKAKRALQTAAPEDSYQAAFADIEKAWTSNDLSLLSKHIRDADTKLSVYSKGKYAYSIASGDFLQITRDAFDRLSTVSFQFTRLRKAKNGDVTAYGKHVYKSAGEADAADDQATTADTVPFSTTGPQPYAKADDPTDGQAKTVYISYTLRKNDDQWYIIGVDSSPNDLVK